MASDQLDRMSGAGMAADRVHVCRLCGAALTMTLIDLGSMPLANALVSAGHLDAPQPAYPLHARVCGECRLVQVEDVVTPSTLFSDYTYFSSYSQTWLDHARAFALESIETFALHPGDLVVELASNDGYLLKNFVGAGIDVLGIEPAANVAEVARAQGVATEVRFFGTDTAHELAGRGLAPKLIVANNVLAHVPDLNDFVEGIGVLLPAGGAASIEVPHLLRLLVDAQFDTIYHEHYSYFSLMALEWVFDEHGLAVADIRELPTHGGSLRITVRHRDEVPHTPERVEEMRRREREFGLDQDDVYQGFASRAAAIRDELRRIIADARRDGATICAYGAAAKGNTLLNYCGLTQDDVQLVADRSPHKQGLWLPGSRIPVVTPDELLDARPDLVLILPWNLRAEISAQLVRIRDWGGAFIVAIPQVEVF